MNDNKLLVLELKRVENIVSKLLEAIREERKRHINYDTLEEEISKIRLHALPRLKLNEKSSEELSDFVLKRNKEFVKKYYKESEVTGFG